MECGNEFYGNFKRSTKFRWKLFYTLCLYLVFICMGWGRGQLGPSFLDLQQIAGVDLETGSWVMTSFYIGYAIGSLLGGVVYERLNRKLTLGIAHIGLSFTYFVIPWCSIFGLMAFTYGVQGIFIGIVDSVANAVLLTLWSKHSKTIYMASSCMFCLGGILSPLTTAPFLLEKTEVQRSNSSAVTSSYNVADGNISSNLDMEMISNGTSKSQTEVSVLYKAFSISGGILLLTAVLCFIAFCSDCKTKVSSKEETKKQGPNEKRSLTSQDKITAISVMAALLCVEVAMDEIMVSHISVFCINHLKWSKQDAALLLSVVFFFVVISGLFGVVLVNFLETRLLTGISLVLSCFSLLGLTLSATYTFQIGVWISVSINGFAKGNVFTLIVNWTNEYIMEMTGKVVSIFMLTVMVGSAVNPILMGYLMEEVENLWFCYLFLIEGLVLIIVFVIALIVTRFIVTRYGPVSQKSEKALEQEVVVSEGLLT